MMGGIMRYVVLALALCFAISPMEAKSKPAKVQKSKNAKKAKVHKAPRQKIIHNKAN